VSESVLGRRRCERRRPFHTVGPPQNKRGSAWYRGRVRANGTESNALKKIVVTAAAVPAVTSLLDCYNRPRDCCTWDQVIRALLNDSASDWTRRN